MQKVGFNFPAEPRRTVLFEVEEWYQKMMAEKLNRPYSPIKRSNFGQYDMAVNYITSVLEEAKAIAKVAVYNIDHMAQVEFCGKDAGALLDRVLPANIASMNNGQCKYTLLLTEKGTVIDDMIVMKFSQEKYVLVINAGHDLTGTGSEHGLTVTAVADADHILKHKLASEDVTVKDISAQLVKIDVQGPLSYKLIKSLYGEEPLLNRNKSGKPMGFFTFNEFSFNGANYILSRTGYTNRWGFELYIPVENGVKDTEKIIEKALELGGMLVGLGGRDENRISAGNVGLPLNGQEYDQNHTCINAPLFNAAVDLTKRSFVGKPALEAELAANPTKQMVLVISEGIVAGRGVYLNGKRLGTCTSSINSPNVSQEKREFIGSTRKNVTAENGTCAIGLAWLYTSPFADAENPQRVKVDFFNEDENKQPTGKSVLGYVSPDGVTDATAPKPLKNIQNL